MIDGKVNAGRDIQMKMQPMVDHKVVAFGAHDGKGGNKIEMPGAQFERGVRQKHSRGALGDAVHPIVRKVSRQMVPKGTDARISGLRETQICV